MNKLTARQALEMMTGMSDIGDLIEPVQRQEPTQDAKK
jgi:uncharacterized short protein YbdD (DUF466 family)